jgi:hypothetical protein
MRYEEINRSVTLICHILDNGPTRLATGFFVSLNGEVYLVTCRHVITQAIKRATGNLPYADVSSTELVLKVRAREAGGFLGHRVPLYVHGTRRWRSYLIEGRVWDVAVVELDSSDLAPLDIRPWTSEEILRREVFFESGTEIHVLTYPEQFSDPVVCDSLGRIESNQHQLFADDRAAVTDTPLFPGASGSPVFRTLQPSRSTQHDIEPHDATLQLVGVFTGAVPRENPQGGHFSYADTIIKIVNANTDCFDEDGLSFRSIDDL